MAIKYEWTVEQIDENGDIVHSDFAESFNALSEMELIEGGRIDKGLVRYEGNEIDGQTDSVWAYIKDGKLPECFSDSMGTPVAIKVPKRFHKEIKACLK